MGWCHNRPVSTSTSLRKEQKTIRTTKAKRRTQRLRMSLSAAYWQRAFVPPPLMCVVRRASCMCLCVGVRNSTAPTIEPEPTKAPNSAATSTAPTIAGSSSSSQPSTAAPSGSSGGISLTSSTGGTSSSSTSSRGAAAGTSKPLRDSGNSVPTVASVAAATSATTGSNPSPPSGRQAGTCK